MPSPWMNGMIGLSASPTPERFSNHLANLDVRSHRHSLRCYGETRAVCRRQDSPRRVAETIMDKNALVVSVEPAADRLPASSAHRGARKRLDNKAAGFSTQRSKKPGADHAGDKSNQQAAHRQCRRIPNPAAPTRRRPVSAREMRRKRLEGNFSETGNPAAARQALSQGRNVRPQKAAFRRAWR